MLFCRMLFIIVKERAVRREARLVADALEVLEARPPRCRACVETFLIGRLPGEPSGMCRHADRLPGRAIHDDRRRHHAEDQGRIAVARMMHDGVEAGRALRDRRRAIARSRPGTPPSAPSPSRSCCRRCPRVRNFPVSFGAIRRVSRRVPPSSQLASSEPLRRLPIQSARNAASSLGLLVEPGPVEERAHVLLAVRAGEPGRVGVDRRVHAEADAGALGDVFDQVHLLPVEVDAIDVIALAEAVEQAALLDPGLEPVDHHVLAALGRVDELKPLVGIWGRVGGEVMGDRARVAIVPVGDPRERLVLVEIDGMRPAAKFLGREVDVPAQILLDPPDRRAINDRDAVSRGQIRRRDRGRGRGGRVRVRARKTATQEGAGESA